MLVRLYCLLAALVMHGALSKYDYPIARKVFGSQAKSQDGEDLALYEQFFQGQRNGLFAEMGALDGVTFSNTYAFEKVLSWSGVLIEANPRLCESLHEHRPNSKNFCTAISSDYSLVNFSKGRFTSTFAAVDTMAARYKSMFHQGSRQFFQVPSLPLGQLLRAAQVRYLDFFSLDVEGAELKVLQTMDWSIPVRVWCIEWNREHSPPENNRSIYELMTANGYERQSWLHEFDSARPLSQNQLWVWRGIWDVSRVHWHQWESRPRRRHSSSNK